MELRAKRKGVGMDQRLLPKSVQVTLFSTRFCCLLMYCVISLYPVSGEVVKEDLLVENFGCAAYTRLIHKRTHWFLILCWANIACNIKSTVYIFWRVSRVTGAKDYPLSKWSWCFKFKACLWVAATNPPFGASGIIPICLTTQSVKNLKHAALQDSSPGGSTTRADLTK